MKKTSFSIILASLILAGCGSESKVETEVQAAEKEAKQDVSTTEKSMSNIAKEATEGAKSVAQDVEAGASQLKADASKAMAENKADLEGIQAPKKENTSQVAASMSNLQKKLTDQLGAQGAAELESAFTTLKQQATNALVASQVDSLSNALGSGDVNSSLSSLTSLSQLAGSGDVNPVTLKDVVSLSSASILSDTFAGDTKPSLIDSAISKLSDSNLLAGATDMVKSLNSGAEMTKNQTGVINDLIDSAMPMLGDFGTQLQQLRQGSEATKSAVDAVKNLF